MSYNVNDLLGDLDTLPQSDPSVLDDSIESIVRNSSTLPTGKSQTTTYNFIQKVGLWVSGLLPFLDKDDAPHNETEELRLKQMSMIGYISLGVLLILVFLMFKKKPVKRRRRKKATTARRRTYKRRKK